MFALLAVLGTIVWGGGSAHSADVTGAGGQAQPGVALPGGQPGIPASTGSSAGGSGSDGGGLSPQVPAAAFDPNNLGAGGTAMPPSNPGTLLQWRRPGNVKDQIKFYVASFPVTGYETYRVSGFTTAEDNESVTALYEVIPIGAVSDERVGYLEFRPDPDDPEGSTYVMWRTNR